MRKMLHDLLSHKAFANAALLKAIQDHEAAANDEELRQLFHHITIANRFWLSLILEREIPDSPEAIESNELAWIAQATDADLARTVETHHLPGRRFSIPEALMQVCLHSHGHRAQCAARLRQLGGTPPATDFILWLRDRGPSRPHGSA
jgi:uncharacterized damage-inducible protein DinB